MEIQNEYADDEFEEDYEDSLDEAVDMEKKITETKPISDLLLEKVSYLDASKQAMLLNLIDQVLVAGSPKKNSGDSGVLSVSSPQVAKSSLHKKKYTPPASPAHVQQSPLKLVIDHLNTTSDPIVDTVIPSTESVVHSDVMIKIRLLSTWESSGFISLEALQLTSSDDDHVYDLNEFKVTVLNGLIPFPFSSTTTQHIHKIFSKSIQQTPRVRVVVDSGWKAPFNKNTQYIEIQLAGSIPTDKVSSLKLRITNSRDKSLLVKDIDVLVGTTCVWSGSTTADDALQVIQVPLSKQLSGSDHHTPAVQSSLSALPQTSVLLATDDDAAVPSWLAELKTPRPVSAVRSTKSLIQSSALQLDTDAEVMTRRASSSTANRPRRQSSSIEDNIRSPMKENVASTATVERPSPTRRSLAVSSAAEEKRTPRRRVPPTQKSPASSPQPVLQGHSTKASRHGRGRHSADLKSDVAMLVDEEPKVVEELSPVIATGTCESYKTLCCCMTSHCYRSRSLLWRGID
jgi:hypothetical protein